MSGLLRLLLLLLLPALAWGQALRQEKVGLFNANKAGDSCSQTVLETADAQALALGQILALPPSDRFGIPCQWTVTSDLTVNSPLFIPYDTTPVLKVNQGVTLTLDACPVTWSDYFIIDANGTSTGSVTYASDCAHCTIGGPNNWIQCTSEGGGSGGGSAVVLDLADNGTLESNSVTEIATTEATPSIFTEPSINKLLINTNQPWPTASALAANGANCATGEAAAGVDASGAAEGCIDIVGGAAGADTEAELEAALTDVTDLFTNNDGALTDDDLSNDNLSALLNVNADADAADNEVLLGTGTEYQGVLMASCNPATEKIHFDPDTNLFSCQTDVSSGTTTLDAAFDAGTGVIDGALCGTKSFKVSTGGDDFIEICVDAGGVPRIIATCDGAGCDNIQAIALDRNFILHDTEATLDMWTIDPDAATPHDKYQIHDGYQLLDSAEWPAWSMFGDGTECDADPTGTAPTQGVACPMTTAETDGTIKGVPITLPGDFDKTADVTFSIKAYLTTDGGAGTWFGQIAIDCVGAGETPGTYGAAVGLDLAPVLASVVGNEIHGTAAAVLDTDTTGADCDPGDTLYWQFTSCDTDATPSTGCTSSAGFEDDMSIFSVRMEYSKNSFSE